MTHPIATMSPERTLPEVWCVGDQLLGTWPGIGSYDSYRSPPFVAAPNADPKRVRKLERGAVRALERRRRGEVTLHASAASVDGVGVLLVGAAGMGKSTHAAALCRLGRGALLADDLAFLTVSDAGILLEPSEDEHWLDADALSLLGESVADDGAKVPAAAARLARAARLGLVVVLNEPSTPSLRRIRGMSLVDPLGRSIIHLPPPMESAESRRRDLDLLAAIASQAVVVEWGPWYNTDDGGLPVFVEAVRTNLAGPR